VGPPLVATVDVEGRTRPDGSVDYGSVDRAAAHVDRAPCSLTLFVTPDVVERRPETVAGWLDGPHCVGLHLHPSRLTGGSDRLDEYDCDAVRGLLERASERFEAVLDRSPTTFRAGRWAYSERLLGALGACGFDRDASLRPTTPTAPYRRGPLVEYPLTVYGNRLVGPLLAPFGVNAVGLHADACLRTRTRAIAFRVLTRWLAHTGGPYLMVAYHDYDLTGRPGERIERHLERLAGRLDPATLDALDRPAGSRRTR